MKNLKNNSDSLQPQQKVTEIDQALTSKNINKSSYQPINNLREKNVGELEKLFSAHFNKLSMKYGYYNVFEHYLDMAINGFCFNYDTKLIASLREKYTQDERYMFGELIHMWIYLCDKKIKTNNMFFDWFGTFYEQNAMSKKQGFAQFFTPEPICIFMAQILNIENPIAKSICEPACGSGRLNLTAHALNHKMFHVANDLDLTCAKMAALNFMMHGIKGIVICDDSLFPKSKFRGAFVTNEQIAPSIRYISDVNEAYAFANHKIGAKPKYKEIIDSLVNLEVDTNVVKERYQEIIDKKGQFSLF